ncbi:MAG: hypothetical protein WCG75_03685 [Armatimonadota bacterium]
MEAESRKFLHLGGDRGPYRRVLIYGVTGSGKTTAARHLADLMGFAWTEVDALMWNPGWDFVPLDVQRERIEAICSQDEWILDAGYAKWMDLVLPRVDLVPTNHFHTSSPIRKLYQPLSSILHFNQNICAKTVAVHN